jgi:hypothetical protein
MITSLSFVTSCEKIRKRWDRNVVCRLDKGCTSSIAKLNSEFRGSIVVEKCTSFACASKLYILTYSIDTHITLLSNFNYLELVQLILRHQIAK